MLIDRRFSIAPMMDYTDRHDRYFLRIIAPHVLLYTEMITAQALKYGDIERHLAFHPMERPVALQLGGNDPHLLAYSASLGQSYGYDEINLNVGCPSDRVKAGRFGACLMLEPNLVADCVAAMQAKVTIPITVKCRIGVDLQDSYDHLVQFIETVQQAGCTIFIIHARKAWLKGLSPKQNREIPPLNYDIVKQVKQDFPNLTIILNGGIRTMADIEKHLPSVDGVMIGREAYSNPYLLTEIEKRYYFPVNHKSRREVIEAYIPYIEEQLNNGHKLSSLLRHLLGLFQNQKGAKLWRRYLSQEGCQAGATTDLLLKALTMVEACHDA